ncbi:MAG: hypothetical protein ANABAC_2337 [Anaerolineae bacterium]|nr:MAG: hypothetical protein ANABAC_2337 [Anaerolineae bacterium]
MYRFPYSAALPEALGLPGAIGSDLHPNLSRGRVEKACLCGLGRC